MGGTRHGLGALLNASWYKAKFSDIVAGVKFQTKHPINVSGQDE
jgi:hypothetical protein